MSARMCKLGVWVFVSLGLLAYDAAAWGPQSQRGIAGTAMQVIRRTFKDAFKSPDDKANYEEDVYRGASDGPDLLNGGKPFTSDREAIVAVENEIRLLRDARKYGFGSYFSYRTGVLASLVADLILPYSLDSRPQSKTIKDAVESDIDAHLDSYNFRPNESNRVYVRDAQEFFDQRRTFFSGAKTLIADDYTRGKRYDGYLKEGGQALFGKAVEAVADVWYTVLRVEGEAGDVAPSPSSVTWYLVAEIQYLLTRKANFYQATKTYENFEKVTKGMPEAYDKVGDIFYAFGTEEAKDRGVREWRVAYDMPGSARIAIGKKLCEHYIKAGDLLLASAAKPGASDQDLPNALNAFTQAMNFDKSNKEAAQKISDTNVAIAARKQRRELNVNIIASAEKVMVQAEKARLASDFGTSMATYNQAIGLFQGINDEFTDQYETSKDRIKEINKNITDIINQILDTASDAIEKGDKAVDAHDFEGAVQQYEQVNNIVAVIPGDETTTHGKDKRDMIELAKKKIDESKIAKSRWEEMERQRKAAAEAAAKAAK